MNNLRDIFQRYEAAVFFDTETTGLDAKSCRIIELAAKGAVGIYTAQPDAPATFDKEEEHNED